MGHHLIEIWQVMYLFGPPRFGGGSWFGAKRTVYSWFVNFCNLFGRSKALEIAPTLNGLKFGGSLPPKSDGRLSLSDRFDLIKSNLLRKWPFPILRIADNLIISRLRHFPKRPAVSRGWSEIAVSTRPCGAVPGPNRGSDGSPRSVSCSKKERRRDSKRSKLSVREGYLKLRNEKLFFSFKWLELLRLFSRVDPSIGGVTYFKNSPF